MRTVTGKPMNAHSDLTGIAEKCSILRHGQTHDVSQYRMQGKHGTLVKADAPVEYFG